MGHKTKKALTAQAVAAKTKAQATVKLAKARALNAQAQKALKQAKVTAAKQNAINKANKQYLQKEKSQAVAALKEAEQLAKKAHVKIPTAPATKKEEFSEYYS